MDAPLLPILLFLLALAVLIVARRSRAATGLPEGDILYDDSGIGRDEAPLYSARHKLTGKPDYLVQRDGSIIPVEVKSGRSPETPYESHIFQLVAYCLLVEEAYGFPPPYGIIRYSDRAFEVDYTPEMKRALLLVMDEMRAQIGVADVPRSHDEARRCYACGFRTICEDRLIE